MRLDQLVWQCGDCDNIYEYSVRYCPNKILDQLCVTKAQHEEESV